MGCGLPWIRLRRRSPIPNAGVTRSPPTRITAARATRGQRRRPWCKRAAFSRPTTSSSALASRAEARRCASALGAATPRRKSAKEIQFIHSDQLLSSREGERLVSAASSCCAVSTRPVKPRAHRPDRDVECTGDLLVAEVGQRVEEQRVPLPRRAWPRVLRPAERRATSRRLVPPPRPHRRPSRSTPLRA